MSKFPFHFHRHIFLLLLFTICSHTPQIDHLRRTRKKEQINCFLFIFIVIYINKSKIDVVFKEFPFGTRPFANMVFGVVLFRFVHFRLNFLLLSLESQCVTHSLSLCGWSEILRNLKILWLQNHRVSFVFRALLFRHTYYIPIYRYTDTDYWIYLEKRGAGENTNLSIWIFVTHL